MTVTVIVPDVVEDRHGTVAPVALEVAIPEVWTRDLATLRVELALTYRVMDGRLWASSHGRALDRLRSAAEAAVYVTPNDVSEYAKTIVELMDDEARRAVLGKTGRVRVEEELAWSNSARAYLGVYRELLGAGQPQRQAGA